MVRCGVKKTSRPLLDYSQTRISQLLITIHGNNEVFEIINRKNECQSMFDYISQNRKQCSVLLVAAHHR